MLTVFFLKQNNDMNVTMEQVLQQNTTHTSNSTNLHFNF